MEVEKVLEEYVKAINEIDDFLEYAYKGRTVESLRDKILSVISEIGENLKEEK